MAATVRVFLPPDTERAGRLAAARLCLPRAVSD